MIALLEQTEIKWTLLLLGLYTVFVLSVLGSTPLWLDELQQVGGTKGKTVFEVMRWAQINPGGVPLPYLGQKYFLDVVPYSTYVARMPAALFSILSGLAFALLCGELGITKLRLAMPIFLLTPIQFRCAVEARGYSQGLFFSMLATWLFVRLWDDCKPALLAAYGVAVILGVYSQPLTGLVPLAHLAFTLISRGSSRKTAPILLTIIFSLACYLPWLILQEQAQQQTQGTSLYSFSLQQIYPWGVVRDLCGDGYACSVPPLILSGVGFTSRNLSPPHKRFLFFVTVFGLLGPILADAAFGYFFAARQLLFAAPPLFLFESEGVLELWRKSRVFLMASLLAVFVAGCVAKNYQQVTRVKENWERAAEILASSLDLAIALW